MVSGVEDYGKTERAEGKAEGVQEATVQYLQNLLSDGYTLDNALKLLHIPQEQYQKYKKLVQKAVKKRLEKQIT